MYTDLKDRFLRGLLPILLAVAPAFAQPQEPKTAKELDEQLLYVLSQRNASLEVVQRLLDRGAHVNQSVGYKTALMHAASEGHLEIVKLLLSKGAEVNAQTAEGTALMMAVRGGQTEIVKLLLESGAEVNAKHRLGDSALIMSAGRSIPEMNPPRGQPLPPPASEVMSLLLANGADPNFIGQWGHTALMEANTAAKVKLLVARGAQVNARDEEGQTALIHAVDRGEVEVVKALLDAGADATVVDGEGATALMQALAEPTNYNTEDAAKLAKSRMEAARLLLSVNVGDLNMQNENGETFLMRAARSGETELVRLLLARGADASLSDVLGNTAAVIAYEKDHTVMQEVLSTRRRPARQVLNAFLRAAVGKKDQAKVRELLKAGADPNYEYAISYDHRNIKSNVLILAVQNGDAVIVKQLLTAGANLNAKGLLHGSEHGLKFGTALDAAENSKNADVINLLRSHKPQ